MALSWQRAEAQGCRRRRTTTTEAAIGGLARLGYHRGLKVICPNEFLYGDSPILLIRPCPPWTRCHTNEACRRDRKTLWTKSHVVEALKQHSREVFVFNP